MKVFPSLIKVYINRWLSGVGDQEVFVPLILLFRHFQHKALISNSSMPSPTLPIVFTFQSLGKRNKKGKACSFLLRTWLEGTYYT